MQLFMSSRVVLMQWDFNPKRAKRALGKVVYDPLVPRGVVLFI